MCWLLSRRRQHDDFAAEAALLGVGIRGELQEHHLESHSAAIELPDRGPGKPFPFRPGRERRINPIRTETKPISSACRGGARKLALASEATVIDPSNTSVPPMLPACSLRESLEGFPAAAEGFQRPDARSLKSRPGRSPVEVSSGEMVFHRSNPWQRKRAELDVLRNCSPLVRVFDLALEKSPQISHGGAREFGGRHFRVSREIAAAVQVRATLSNMQPEEARSAQKYHREKPPAALFS